MSTKRQRTNGGNAAGNASNPFTELSFAQFQEMVESGSEPQLKEIYTNCNVLFQNGEAQIDEVTKQLESTRGELVYERSSHWDTVSQLRDAEAEVTRLKEVVARLEATNENEQNHMQATLDTQKETIKDVIAERDSAHKTLRATEGELVATKAKLTQRDTEIARMNAKLGALNEKMDENEERWFGLCLQTDAELARKDAELTQKDAELARKDAELTQKDAELTQKDAELTQKDAELTQKDAELDVINRKNDEQKAEIAHLEEDLRLEQVRHKWDETRDKADETRDKANVWDAYKRLSGAIFLLERFDRNRTQMPQQDINDIVKDAHEMFTLHLHT